VPHEFKNREEEPEPLASGAGNRPPPERGVGVDVFDDGEPNKPPAALMGRKWNYAMWILLALALGGLIALFMVVLSS
jgi:hypothetical protein